MFVEINSKEAECINGGIAVWVAVEIIASVAYVASEVYSAYEGYQDAKKGVYNPNGRPGN